MQNFETLLSFTVYQIGNCVAVLYFCLYIKCVIQLMRLFTFTLSLLFHFLSQSQHTQLHFILALKILFGKKSLGIMIVTYS